MAKKRKEEEWKDLASGIWHLVAERTLDRLGRGHDRFTCNR